MMKRVIGVMIVLSGVERWWVGEGRLYHGERSRVEVAELQTLGSASVLIGLKVECFKTFSSWAAFMSLPSRTCCRYCRPAPAPQTCLSLTSELEGRHSPMFLNDRLVASSGELRQNVSSVTYISSTMVAYRLLTRDE